jgi:hypothetical protein
MGRSDISRPDGFLGPASSFELDKISEKVESKGNMHEGME